MSFFKNYKDVTEDLQKTFAVAVVIPTTLRPSIAKALLSIFQQKDAGRIQILIGIDKPERDPQFIEEICQKRPSNVTVSLFYPGYSTSVLHQGLHSSCCGGVLRCVLTYLANARHVAYLDDDNWWAPNHLSSLKSAIAGKDWAYSLRWFVHPESLQPICIDQWESVGPGRGIFKERFGGFSDPNTLMIDKLTCEPVIHYWTRKLPGPNGGDDRYIFHALNNNYQVANTNQATAFYVIDPFDVLQPLRLKMCGRRYIQAGAKT